MEAFKASSVNLHSHVYIHKFEMLSAYGVIRSWSIDHPKDRMKLLLAGVFLAAVLLIEINSLEKSCCLSDPPWWETTPLLRSLSSVFPALFPFNWATHRGLFPPPPHPFSFLKTTFVGRRSWNRFHSIGFLGPAVSIVKKKWYICCGCQQKGMMQLVWWHWRLLICRLQLLSLYV